MRGPVFDFSRWRETSLLSAASSPPSPLEPSRLPSSPSGCGPREGPARRRNDREGSPSRSDMPDPTSVWCLRSPYRAFSRWLPFTGGWYVWDRRFFARSDKNIMARTCCLAAIAPEDLPMLTAALNAAVCACRCEHCRSRRLGAPSARARRARHRHRPIRGGSDRSDPPAPLRAAGLRHRRLHQRHELRRGPRLP